MDEYRKNNFSNPMETCWKIQLARRRLSYFQGEITKCIVSSKQYSPVRRTVSSQDNRLQSGEPVLSQKSLLDQRTNWSGA